MKISQMKSTSTATVCMDRTFLSVMKAILNYGRTFELQYGASFVEARIKDTVDDMMPSQHLLEQSLFSRVRFVRFSRMMIKNENVLPLLESLNEIREGDNELGMSYSDREVLQATQSSFVVLFTEAADLYINNPSKPTTFQSTAFFVFASNC